jgi:hypothetical protein
MAWYLVKHGDNFTFYFSYTHPLLYKHGRLMATEREQISVLD